MGLKAHYFKRTLHFKRPSGTSRGVLRTKEAYFIKIEDGAQWGIGECGLLAGLSYDDRPDYEDRLQWACDHIAEGFDSLYDALSEYPSIQAGVEMAFMSIQAADPFVLFPSEFTSGNASIPINGLIWMGDLGFMREQVEERLQAGFDCIKMKIGAIDLDKELSLLESIRKQHAPEAVTLRVDANGAFEADAVLPVLKRLKELAIHSIEQPIAKAQVQAMHTVCQESPIPIALDEELIGVIGYNQKKELLKRIQPQFIILKPSFVGGFRGSEEWIRTADELGIGWWITSALESNVGLNAIAQWTYHINASGPQGLGTGSLYVNNIDSPLVVANGTLSYHPNQAWNLNF